MSIQYQGTGFGIPLTGDGVSREVDVNLRKLPPTQLNQFPIGKITSIQVLSATNGFNIPSVTLKGDVATFTFDSPVAAFDPVAGSGGVTLQVILTFETE